MIAGAVSVTDIPPRQLPPLRSQCPVRLFRSWKRDYAADRGTVATQVVAL